jgi:uncharacterized membrane protein
VTLAPLLAAPAIVQIHVAAAVTALVVGIFVLLLRKGTPLHLAMGRLWAGLMLVTAIGSFWITGLWPGHFSPIHLLSAFTICMVALAIWFRRRGNIRGHARTMIFTFAGLLGAGAFTLLPGRIMAAVLFGP